MLAWVGAIYSFNKSFRASATKKGVYKNHHYLLSRKGLDYITIFLFSYYLDEKYVKR